MLNIISKYFHDTDEYQNAFNSPANDNDINDVEKQLGILFPYDYKDFLKFTNGFDGQIKEFIVSFDPVQNIYQSTLDTCLTCFPWAIYLGTNGNIEMFVLDTRQNPFQFGVLPNIGEEEDFIPLGNTFEKFIARLYYNTVFEK